MHNAQTDMYSALKIQHRILYIWQYVLDIFPWKECIHWSADKGARGRWWSWKRECQATNCNPIHWRSKNPSISQIFKCRRNNTTWISHIESQRIKNYIHNCALSQVQNHPTSSALSPPKSSKIGSQGGISPPSPNTSHEMDHHDQPFSLNFKCLSKQLPPFYSYCCYLSSHLWFLYPDTEIAPVLLHCQSSCSPTVLPSIYPFIHPTNIYRAITMCQEKKTQIWEGNCLYH